MKLRWKLFTLACWLVSVLVTDQFAFADDPSRIDQWDQKHVRLLTVGNSFTRNANRFLNDLVKASGHRLTHETLIVGGSPLQLHAGMALAYEENSSDPASHYADNRSLQDLLRTDVWDFVTIQQASIKSHDLQTYQPYASQLADVVHRYAPQAQLLIHQTWAYRSDDPRFNKPSTKPGEPNTQEAMYRGLTDAYRTITSELNAKRIPVGDAFFMAASDPMFGYHKDELFKTNSAVFPELPNQRYSLHIGWQWKMQNDQQTLQLDGHHANIAGEYLGACVWFEALFGESPIGNSFVPATLDIEHAKFLQLTAHRAMTAAQDTPRGTAPAMVQAFNDAQPQRYVFQARASELDPRTKEYPEIDFVFGQQDKPQDLQRASVDTRIAPQGKLVIWLMGDNSALFERLNNYGLHAIQVSYAKNWFGTLCRPQPSDAYARGRIRLEAVTGEDGSDELNLAKPDGAQERALQMVKWLANENPTGLWEQFLIDDGDRLRWDKIIVSGSSHGSTTAARFALHQRVDRVVMLCGPRDQDQDWQSLHSATPANRYFGFSHVLDGGWSGDHYCRSWEMLGMHRFGPVITVDGVAPPYDNTRRLISAADVGDDAKRAHSSVTPGKASPKDSDGHQLYEPVWHYLFNHPVDSRGEATDVDPSCLRIQSTAN